MTTVTITLSSGEAFQVLYSWTFGEMAITFALLLLVIVTSLRWLYDVVLYLWQWRVE